RRPPRARTAPPCRRTAGSGAPRACARTGAGSCAPGDEAVAGPAHRLDELPGLELLAQPAHQDIDRARVELGVDAAQRVQDLLAAEGLAGAAGEQRQQADRKSVA